jgi:ATP-dependent DNA helicase RecG
METRMEGTPLQQLLAAGESARLEFKSKISDYAEIGKIIASFLNAEGGTLVIGVDDSGQIIGIDSAGEEISNIQGELLNAISPKASWSINIRNENEKNVIVIDVPQGLESPYVFGNRIFVRQGTHSVPATSDAIDRLITRRSQDELRWERLPALGVEIADLDEDEIRRTANEAIKDRLYSFRSTDTLGILEELSLATGEMIRNSAVILFGKRPERRFPQLRIRAARFEGTSVLSSFRDNRSFEGHAFALIEKSEGFLRDYISIASELPKEGTKRTDRPAYPWKALREALLNAIVHRDYAAFDGGVSISVFDDRIEFWNSGTLPEGMTVDDLKGPHPSRPHNPDIANVFYVRGYIERWGIGTSQIVARCLEAGLPEPQWEEAAGGGVRLTIRLARPAEGESRLNHRQIQLLTRLKVGQRITPDEYFSSVQGEAKERRARKDLTELVEKGYLNREGQGPATTYIRTDIPLPLSGTEDSDPARSGM